MSIIARAVPLLTDGSGVASATVRAGGCRLLGVSLELGTLDTPNVAITDEPNGTELLSLAAAAADGVFQPMVAASDPADGTALTGAFAAPAVFGRIEVAVTGGGASKTGEITLLLER